MKNSFKKIFHKQKISIHIVLFIVTFFTTIVAGMEWITGQPGPYNFSDLTLALPYAFAILFMLASHEFGHYFAAHYHKIKATLPFFIPFPPVPGFLNFGTLGAVIKTKSPIPNNKVIFDVGVAGPIAGFIACLIILIYGFSNLPGKEYLLKIHPDFFSQSNLHNNVTLEFGSNLIFIFFTKIFVPTGVFMPPMSEIYHYPYLCVGWFGLFVTAMNMIPVGQLDGGHVIYGMFGTKKQQYISGISMVVLLLLGFVGLFDVLLDLKLKFGWSGWLFWVAILYFTIKIKHPELPNFQKLDSKRMLIGYISLFIFIISFTPTPFTITL